MYPAIRLAKKKEILSTADKARNNRKLLDGFPGSPAANTPLGDTWFDKLKRRHSCNAATSTKLLERSCCTATNPANLGAYFAELGALLDLNK